MENTVEEQKPNQEEDGAAAEMTASEENAVSTDEAGDSLKETEPVAARDTRETGQEEKFSRSARQKPEGQAARVLSGDAARDDAEIQRAKFPPLQARNSEPAAGKISYLKDVDLEASVELGNTTMNVEKILALGVGSIVELNQTVGEQVRFMINGNAYAMGEVVVIGEKFGIRVSQILHGS